MSHFRRLRGLPSAVREVHVEPEAACHPQQDPAEVCDTDASALSLLASLRAASTRPSPWESTDEERSPPLLPHGGPSFTLAVALPAAVVQDVPSADGSAAETCARSDEAAAAAMIASRAQTEHAEHLQGLLQALQQRDGTARDGTATPQPQLDGVVAPQLDNLLASLKQCRASLDEQQQICNAELEAEAGATTKLEVASSGSGSSPGSGSGSGSGSGPSPSPSPSPSPCPSQAAGRPAPGGAVALAAATAAGAAGGPRAEGPRPLAAALVGLPRQSPARQQLPGRPSGAA